MSSEYLPARELPLVSAIERGACGIGFVTGYRQGRLQRLNPERTAMRSVGEKECARLRDWFDTLKPNSYSHSSPCSVEFGNPRTIGTPCKSMFLGRYA
jgi:hypothetical protein